MFALQPYSWFQGVKHLHCLSCAVPLLAALAVELALGRIVSLRKLPAYAWIGCALAGLSYAYIAFFSCFVLSIGAALAWAACRDSKAFGVGILLVAGVAAVALADLTPSLTYRAHNGENASMLFKSPAEGEVYALKLRYLLTPSPDHPFGFMRRWEQRLASVKFPPIQNENEYSRLGTIGSAGLLCLLGVSLGALVNTSVAERASSSVLGPSAALTLVCILAASTGGLNVFFNTFVTPEIRAWARIFPFIGFFCVAAAGSMAASFCDRCRGVRGTAVVAAVTLLAVFDQAVPSSAYDRRDAVYRQDEKFVERIESLLPTGSAVFELPYVDFPNDNRPANLLVNDMLRPYLHSRKYRWSAGAVSGTSSAEWGRLVAGLPVTEMLDALVHREFAGLWVDLAGYAGALDKEKEITEAVGAEPVKNSGRRFLFYDLRSYAAGARGLELTLEAAQLRARNPVQALFERGFYFAELGGDGPFRWSLRYGRITLVNPLPVSRRVSLHMKIAPARPGNYAVRIELPGRSDRITIPGFYSTQVDVPPSGRAAINLVCACPGLRTVTRTVVFYVSRFKVEENGAR